MKRRYALLLCLGTLASIALAAPPSGHTDWGPWRFDWVAGAQNASLTLRNVYYEDELLLYKGSMSVIRVQYANNACGPFADLLSEYTLLSISNCNNAVVCQRSFSSAGRRWLELGILVQLGQYCMYRVWYLSEDGYLQPHFFSKELQCQVDHDHHPYWRLDLDIAGAGSDQLFVYDNSRPNQGWGPGWLDYNSEFNDRKNPATGRVWFVRDNQNAHGAWILPGRADGTPNTFSDKDAAGRRYNWSEDEPWPFGAWGHLGYGDGGSLAETDVIFWYVPHMFHAAAEGSSLWHSVGPWLYIHR